MHIRARLFSPISVFIRAMPWFIFFINRIEPRETENPPYCSSPMSYRTRIFRFRYGSLDFESDSLFWIPVTERSDASRRHSKFCTPCLSEGNLACWNFNMPYKNRTRLKGNEVFLFHFPRSKNMENWCWVRFKKHNFPVSRGVNFNKPRFSNSTNSPENI